MARTVCRNVETYNHNHLLWLTTEAVLTETFYPRERKTPQFRAGI